MVCIFYLLELEILITEVNQYNGCFCCRWTMPFSTLFGCMKPVCLHAECYFHSEKKIYFNS